MSWEPKIPIRCTIEFVRRASPPWGSSTGHPGWHQAVAAGGAQRRTRGRCLCPRPPRSGPHRPRYQRTLGQGSLQLSRMPNHREKLARTLSGKRGALQSPPSNENSGRLHATRSYSRFFVIAGCPSFTCVLPNSCSWLSGQSWNGTWRAVFWHRMMGKPKHSEPRESVLYLRRRTIGCHTGGYVHTDRHWHIDANHVTFSRVWNEVMSACSLSPFSLCDIFHSWPQFGSSLATFTRHLSSRSPSVWCGRR